VYKKAIKGSRESWKASSWGWGGVVGESFWGVFWGLVLKKNKFVGATSSNLLFGRKSDFEGATPPGTKKTAKSRKKTSSILRKSRRVRG